MMLKLFTKNELKFLCIENEISILLVVRYEHLCPYYKYGHTQKKIMCTEILVMSIQLYFQSVEFHKLMLPLIICT